MSRGSWRTVSVAVAALALTGWCSPAASAALSSPLAFGGATRADARGLVSLSCASARLCVGVDSSGRAVTSTRPTDGAVAWRTETISGPAGPVQLTKISCPSTRLCVAIDASDDVVSSTDPGVSAPLWRVAHIGNLHPPLAPILTDIACPTGSLCVVTDDAGDVITSPDPAGQAEWTVSHIDQGTTYECVHYDGTQGGCQPALESVTCPSQSRCVALDQSGNELSSNEPTGGAEAWQAIGGFNNDPGDAFWGLQACALSLCLTAQNYDSGIYAHSLTELPAALPAFIVGGSVSALTCPSASLCLAGDYASKGTGPAHLYVSAKPQTGAWRSVYTVSPGPTGAAMAAISCPSTSLCFAADSAGRVTVGTPSPTTAQLTAALHALITPSGHQATIRRILDQRGYRKTITAPLTGRFTITWQRPVTRGAHTPHGAPITVLASSTSDLVKGQRAAVLVKLTAAGRRLLSRATRRLSLIAHGRLVPTSRPAITVTNRINLLQE
jgi:hypothetical protein